MNKHTPGPWILNSPDCDPSIDDSNGNCIISGNWEGGLYAPVAADLILATAAPDLLEALEEILDGYLYGCDMKTKRENIKKANAAIAKARGEA